MLPSIIATIFFIIRNNGGFDKFLPFCDLRLHGAWRDYPLECSGDPNVLYSWQNFFNLVMTMQDLLGLEAIKVKFLSSVNT